MLSRAALGAIGSVGEGCSYQTAIAWVGDRAGTGTSANWRSDARCDANEGQRVGKECSLGQGNKEDDAPVGTAMTGADEKTHVNRDDEERGERGGLYF